MRYLIWILRVVVFIVLFGLAIKNSATVGLRFYFDQHIEVPLSLVILGAFVIGATAGISVAVVTLLRQRRELGRMRRHDDVVVRG